MDEAPYTVSRSVSDFVVAVPSEMFLFLIVVLREVRLGY